MRKAALDADVEKERLQSEKERRRDDRALIAAAELCHLIAEEKEAELREEREHAIKTENLRKALARAAKAKRSSGSRRSSGSSGYGTGTGHHHQVVPAPAPAAAADLELNFGHEARMLSFEKEIATAGRKSDARLKEVMLLHAQRR